MSAVAVITGASRGIGLAVARELAARGFTVVQVDRDPVAAARVEGRCSCGGWTSRTGQGSGGSLATMGGGTPAYQVSKAALNAFTRTLAGELHDDGILVNAVSPGWTATDLGGPGGRPVEEGAASVVWAALLPDDGPTGGFFHHGEPVLW